MDHFKTFKPIEWVLLHCKSHNSGRAKVHSHQHRHSRRGINREIRRPNRAWNLFIPTSGQLEFDEDGKWECFVKFWSRGGIVLMILQSFLYGGNSQFSHTRRGNLALDIFFSGGTIIVVSNCLWWSAPHGSMLWNPCSGWTKLNNQLS